MQICKLLNVEAPLPGIVVEQEERLTAGILRLWDRTPEGADRLLRLLETVDEVRKAQSVGQAPGHKRRTTRLA